MKATHVLVKVRGDGRAFATQAAQGFGAAATTVEPILTVPAVAAGPGMAAAGVDTWLRMPLPSGATGNPWDDAHALVAPMQGFAATGGYFHLIEPDIEQDWLPAPDTTGVAALAPAAPCTFSDQTDAGNQATRKGEFAWNLGDAFSELLQARQAFGPDLESQLRQIVIAHLDTGYDRNHITLPINIDLTLQRNFADPSRPNDATDDIPPGKLPMTNRGHGTATLALLAGNRLDGSSSGSNGFKDFIGGAPFARVIPIRIADWVVRLSTSTMVQGIDYARQSGAHVLSMSMGGLTSAALVDAVNLAYEAGLVLVTAAGNNFSGAIPPTPTSIVFPARYQRVLAATGVMADGNAYAGLGSGTMQGNYGPPSKMATAIGAYTPNVPWACIGCQNLVDMDGSGTSAATPQVAAAVALWLARHAEELAHYPQPWMRVEAVRRALFLSAAKTTAAMTAAETQEKLGQGVMKALGALAIAPAVPADLTKLEPSQASWGWLDLITDADARLAAGAPDPRRAMFALELTQMAQRSGAVDAALSETDPSDGSLVPANARRRYLEAALDAGSPSKPLKELLESILERSGSGSGGDGTKGGGISTSAAAAIPPKPPIKRVPKKLPPPRRRLRVFALDPSMAKSLESVDVNETTLAVRWEDNLKPGPVGEYVEVVDVDPASNRIYEPVDLNTPLLLAQDGWPPSEGNPQFHQQMVYAVAMTTIQHFEEALGRKALWATRDGPVRPDGSYETLEVPRLRIYPHALRTENAYYSPQKVALLLGYFPAQSTEEDATPPGSMVFSCLSSDVVAHEMSHALLDGLHRKFEEASNPDVPAFHEAFADIVALFQHFAMPELVRFQIAKAQGRLDAAQLLGGLARQFGEGTGRHGPLRNYVGADIAKLDYTRASEMHDRGSILVYAIYEAFLNIVDRRTRDLIRLATSGSGILPQGALHPDLVGRLTDETCKTARHVLRMCIRALDYCPAVDITFGEYLRALITADIDLVADDSLHYRVGFIEAFRKRRLLPRDVRTVSEVSLAWSTLADPNPAWLKKAIGKLDLRWGMSEDRTAIFERAKANCAAMHAVLAAEIAHDPALCGDFGLNPGEPRYGRDGKTDERWVAGQTTFEVLGVRPVRRVAPDGTLRTEVVASVHQRRPEPIDPSDPSAGWFWFRGGTTLILDVREENPEIRYSIVKNIGSVSRLGRQRAMVQGQFLSPLRALYFGQMTSEPFALLHADQGDSDHA